MFSISYLNALRKIEIGRIAAFFEPGARILEIGAGTGEQARDLQTRGFDVSAVEVARSNYAQDRQFPVVDYDGRHIPLPDGAIDIVFSSNVLEHVPDLSQMHAEIRRVLKPSGYCVHVMPTHTWRLWTTLTAAPDAILYLVAAVGQLVPRAVPRKGDLARMVRASYRRIRFAGWRLRQRRHGGRGNLISEHWLFHPHWWRANFESNGFTIVHDEPVGLFYTGNNLLGRFLSFSARARVARVLGSGCHLFKVVPAGPGHPAAAARDSASGDRHS